MNNLLDGRIAATSLCLLIAFSLPAGAGAATPEMSPGVEIVPHDDAIFGPDPDYGEHVYDAEAQKAIYGGKRAVPTPRPLLELGRPQYQAGPLTAGRDWFGERNLAFPALSVYGDWRTAVADNDNGERKLGQVATRLNLDVDLKLTATERLHMFLRPLDRNNEFTRYEFSGDTGEDDSEFLLDGNLETLFFEGDLGAIVTGATGKPTRWDMPFAIGLMPLLFQNGVWLEDAFTGIAITRPAQNSPALDISNYDVTFFAGFDEVSSLAIRDENGEVADEDVNVYGIASFIETRGGYAEIDYAFVDGRDRFDEFDYHNFSVGYTRRIADHLSTSLRAIFTFGQDTETRERTAGGVLWLWENSLITSKPSTLVPYFNLFAGFNRPQSVARDNGGILKNTGINFETDGLTGFPLLDDTGHDTWGGAIGVEYLFNLDQQLVVELATVQLMDDDDPIGPARGDQYALGIRYQRPLNNAWIFRFDAMKGWRDNDEDISGVRLEIRRKF